MLAVECHIVYFSSILVINVCGSGPIYLILRLLCLARRVYIVHPFWQPVFNAVLRLWDHKALTNTKDADANLSAQLEQVAISMLTTLCHIIQAEKVIKVISSCSIRDALQVMIPRVLRQCLLLCREC